MELRRDLPNRRLSPCNSFSCSSVLPCPSERGVESFRQHHCPRVAQVTARLQSLDQERKVFVPEEKKWHFPSAYYLSQRYLTLFAVGLTGEIGIGNNIAIISMLCRLGTEALKQGVVSDGQSLGGARLDRP